MLATEHSMLATEHLLFEMERFLFEKARFRYDMEHSKLEMEHFLFGKGRSKIGKLSKMSKNGVLAHSGSGSVEKGRFLGDA